MEGEGWAVIGGVRHTHESGYWQLHVIGTHRYLTTMQPVPARSTAAPPAPRTTPLARTPPSMVSCPTRLPWGRGAGRECLQRQAQPPVCDSSIASFCEVRAVDEQVAAGALQGCDKAAAMAVACVPA